MPFKAFWKNRIFTEAERTQSLHFWSNFDPNLPPDDGRNQKKLFISQEKIEPSGYPNQSKSISPFNFQWKV